jgi:transposase
MAGAYSRDLRDRVINAVVVEGMSRQAAAARSGVSESSAIKWVERFERSGSRAAAKMGGYKRVKLEPHRGLLEGLRTEKSDITLQALCDRLRAERAGTADTSLMRRFLRRLGVALKKKCSSHASRTARMLSGIGCPGEAICGASILRGWSSSMNSMLNEMGINVVDNEDAEEAEKEIGEGSEEEESEGGEVAETARPTAVATRSSERRRFLNSK